MPVKKTTEKKTAVKTTVKKTVSKPVNKTVEVKTEKVTKPQVVVETKKINNNHCWAECTCEWKCSCGWFLKCLIIVLVAINLILAIILCVKNCQKGAWAIEAMKDGWKENMEKAIQIYQSDYYVDAQTQSITAYAEQMWAAEAADDTTVEVSDEAAE